MKDYGKFIGSLSFDARLAFFDVVGSIAHVKMLAKCGIISQQEAKRIIKGLLAILAGMQKGRRLPQKEDVHYAIEAELIKRIGPVGGKMHTARSRNDQVALDLRLYIRDEIRAIYELLVSCQKSILVQAKKNLDAVAPGYTHLQPAQPILFSHQLLAYAWMFERDKERLKDCFKRVNELPLGSAALAGTSFPIDRKYVAKLLGFSAVTKNSIDAVSDRDFAVEFISCLAIIMTHLSRLAEEMIIWSSVEFGFVKLSGAFTTGSSIMPQKKNPDAAELVRGKTGRVFGDLAALLTVMKGLSLAYNRDLQEDKPPVFDAADTVSGCLEVTAEMIATMQVSKKRMEASAKKGFIGATELADYLAKKGIPFRKAHGIVKGIVDHCAAGDISLDGLSVQEYREFSKLFGPDVKKCIDPKNIIESKKSLGGTSSKQVRMQIEELSKKI
ncbi:MAG: argininosuccinate lyase [Endomicrobiales bacterium]|nr:argininosuccinate lyase [Endomicrobiales bacterium]